MIITYLRSSSYNGWDFCQMQYFLTNVCGYTYAPGQKAEMGTITHKVLEVLACMKKTLQDNPEATFCYDQQLGRIDFDSNTWLDEYYLSSEEVDEVNKSRRNKQTYKVPADISEGHYRRGVDLVDHIFSLAYEYYTSKSIHKWYPQNKKDCLNFVWMALDYKDGIFDPRNRTIVEPELQFDITIDREWANYDYVIDGKHINGKLALKGTIDLPTYVDDNQKVIEVVDWKTGQRLDWANGGEKDYAKLRKDPQLLLYGYALTHLFPDAESIMLTIFFIRDGGPFTIMFGPDEFNKAENMLRKRFEEIQRSEKPKLFDESQKHFKCTYLCPFYKNKFTKNDPLNMCRRAKRTIEEVGIDQATEEMMKPGHDVGKYDAPGE